jgi:hypothetical protein
MCETGVFSNGTGQFDTWLTQGCKKFHKRFEVHS